MLCGLSCLAVPNQLQPLSETVHCVTVGTAEMQPTEHRQVAVEQSRHGQTCVDACGVQAESMPLHGTVGQLLNRLIAAGVGQRPVIFVTHRSAPSPATHRLAPWLTVSHTVPVVSAQLAVAALPGVRHICLRINALM